MITVDLRQDVGSWVHIQGFVFSSSLKLRVRTSPRISILEWVYKDVLGGRLSFWCFGGNLPINALENTTRIWTFAPSMPSAVLQLASCWETLGPDRQWPSIDIKDTLASPCLLPFSSSFIKRLWAALCVISGEINFWCPSALGYRVRGVGVMAHECPVDSPVSFQNSFRLSLTKGSGQRFYPGSPDLSWQGQGEWNYYTFI